MTQKILERPRLLERIRRAVADPSWAHITCFNASPLERSLAVQLGIPLYASDPSLSDLGNKSMGRQLLREEGVAVPPGAEHLRDESDVASALVELKRADPALGRAHLPGAVHQNRALRR